MFDEAKARVDKIKMSKDFGKNDATWDCDCKATVLIVDDNPFNLLPLRLILSKQELQVVEAYNGS